MDVPRSIVQLRNAHKMSDDIVTRRSFPHRCRIGIRGHLRKQAPALEPKWKVTIEYSTFELIDHVNHAIFFSQCQSCQIFCNSFMCPCMLQNGVYVSCSASRYMPYPAKNLILLLPITHRHPSLSISHRKKSLMVCRTHKPLCLLRTCAWGTHSQMQNSCKLITFIPTVVC